MKIDWALFSYPFTDPRWKTKAAIGGALALFGTFLFLPFFWLLLPLQGYMLRILRRTARGEPPSLPEWDNWGELFGDGLRLWVVSFIYNLPVLVLVCCVYGLWLSVGIGIPALAENAPRSQQGLLIFGMMGVYAISFLIFGLMMLLAIPLMFLNAGAMARLAATDSLSAALEFGAVFRHVRSGLKNYTIALLGFLAVAFGISFVAQMLIYTLILACLYPFVLALATVYLQALIGALLGMAYYQTVHPPEKLPAPTEAQAAPPAVTAKDTDPLLKTDPLLRAPKLPAPEDKPAEPKRRAPAGRKKKSTGGEPS